MHLYPHLTLYFDIAKMGTPSAKIMEGDASSICHGHGASKKDGIGFVAGYKSPAFCYAAGLSNEGCLRGR